MKKDILKTLKYISYLVNNKKNEIKEKKEEMEQHIIQVYEGDDRLSLLGAGFIYKVDIDDTIEKIDDSKDELIRLFTIDKDNKVGDFTIGYPIDTNTFLSLKPYEINNLDKYLFYVGENNIELLFKATNTDNPQHIFIEGDSKFFHNDYALLDDNQMLLRRTQEINCSSDIKTSEEFSGYYLINNDSIEKLDNTKGKEMWSTFSKHNIKNLVNKKSAR